MPRVTSKLIEQSVDARSNEIAYEYQLQNQGATALHLIGLRPRIPDRVELKDVRDITELDLQTRHASTCRDLTQLLNSHLLTTSSDARDRLRVIYSEVIKAAADELNSFWRLYFRILTGGWSAQIARYRLQETATQLTIESLDDAHNATTLLEGPNDAKLPQIFYAKLRQLELMEARLQNGTRVLATLEPDSIYSTTYVFKFPRGVINSRRFNVAIEAVLEDGETKKQHSTICSTALTISPRPLVLSLIAVASALLGVILDISISGTVTAGTRIWEANSWLANEPRFTSAAILAIVFFNIYEFTEVGKRLTVGLGWRAAMLAGFLCGLLSDRIVDALKALLGSSG